MTTGEPVWQTPRRGPVLGVERRRRSARDADAQQRSRLHVRRDRHPERARRRDRRRRLVAQRRDRHRQEGPDLGLHQLAAGRRRRRRRRRLRHARRLRRRHRQAALVRPLGRRQLQLAASRDDRRRRPDPAAERTRRDQRRAGRRHGALGARVVTRRHRAAGPDRGRRRPGQRHRHARAGSARAAFAVSARIRRMDRRGALDVERAEAVLQRLRRAQGPRLRLRRQHPLVHRSRGRQAQVEGRTLRQRPARPAGRSGPAAGAVGGRRAGAGRRRRPTSSRSSRGSRRSTARPGTTRCWSATSCWFATARRWRRSGCRVRAADRVAIVAFVVPVD